MQHSTVGFLIALAYGVSSASMAFANKAVLSYYQYDYPVFLVTVQMLFTIGMLELLSWIHTVTVTHYSVDRGRGFFWPSVFYAINSVLGLSALSGMNIPMYGMVKRCGPLVTLSLGAALLGKGRPSAALCVPVGMITLGCIVAGFGDLAFDGRAYLFGFASVFSQSIYQVLVQKTADSSTALDTLLLNSYNCVPLLVIWCVMTGELQAATAAFSLTSVGFLITFTLVISMGAVLNYLLFLCITFNSALTTTITGTLKGIFSTVVGMFTFGGISINIYTISGILLNLSGAIIYSVLKYQDSRAKTLAKSKSMLTMEEVKVDGLQRANGRVGGSHRAVTHRLSQSEDENGQVSHHPPPGGQV